MVKKVLRSAEKFSEAFPLSPLPLYPSPTFIRDGETTIKIKFSHLMGGA